MLGNGAEDIQRGRNPPVYRMLSPGILLSGDHWTSPTFVDINQLLV